MNEVRALPPATDLDSINAVDHHHGDSPFAIFGRLHRLLRGRYKYAVPVAAICAAAGAVGGYLLTTPKFESVGTVWVQSNIQPKLYQTEFTNIGQFLNAYVRRIANNIEDPQVVSAAMRSDEWKGLGRSADFDAQEKFQISLDVVTDPREPEWIRVKFRDEDALASKVAVEQVLKAYADIHGSETLIINPATIDELQYKSRRYQGEIVQRQKDIQGILSKSGTTNLEALQNSQLEALAKLDQKCMDLKIGIQQAEAANKAREATPDPKTAGAITGVQIAQIAHVDEAMHRLIDQRDTYQSRLDWLRSKGLSDLHKDVKQVLNQIQIVEGRIDEYAKAWVAQNGGVVPMNQAPGAVIPPEAIEPQKKYLEQLEHERDEIQKAAFTTNDARLQVEALNEEIRTKQAYLTDIERRLTQLTTETPPAEAGSVSGRVRITPPLDLPHRPTIDNRRKLGLVGFLLGGGLPLAGFMLAGLLDRRYRYSDDAGTGRMHPTLLGILPYLPDNMANPEQAAVAAHCVHHIRTLLQISGAQQDRRVFAVTSPTAGDGKTSLSLSLGLSFAASGSETCLIDFDMIGGGLSSSMQAKSDFGLMDAMEKGELNGHIRPTAFPRLSILPVGRHDGQEVSRLSPEIVRRVIEEAKRRFDVVVIDTGPILGSIEASLVSSAADGVILAIGRGQSRTQAERAMEYLTNVRATLIGVVFNRAEPNDFRRAVSSASVRSVPMQNGQGRPFTRALPALGPMASTVASHSSPAENGSHDDDHTA
jgi:polysaccharide biosynthesis transport protein